MPLMNRNAQIKLMHGKNKIKKMMCENAAIYSSGNAVYYYVDGIKYTEEFESGQSCLSPTSFTPSKAECTFLGWSESPNSTTVLDNKIMEDDSIELFAVFKYNDLTKSVSIKYSAYEEYYAVGQRKTLGTFYTGVDKSKYVSAFLQLSSVSLESSYAWAPAYLYLSDGTTDAQIAMVQKNGEGGYYIKNIGTSATLTFKTDTGNTNLSLVMYNRDMNQVTYTVIGGTLKLSGRTIVSQYAPIPDEPDVPDVPVEPTNVIKTSIDSTGAIFNNGQGWADESRIGSGKLESYIGTRPKNYFNFDDITYKYRLQNDVPEMISSNAQNVVVGWTPITYGKYYALSALYLGDEAWTYERTTRGRPIGSPTTPFITRINAKKSDGSVIVYGNTWESTENGILQVGTNGVAITMPDPDIVAIQMQVNCFFGDNGKDISTPAKLAELKFAFTEGDTVQQAIDKGFNYTGASSFCITGHMEIDPTIDNVIRLREMTLDKNNTDTGIAFYDETFTRAKMTVGGNGDWITPVNLANTSLGYDAVLDGNNVVQFTLKSGAGYHINNPNIKYIAICSDHISDDSIITINQEID